MLPLSFWVVLCHFVPFVSLWVFLSPDSMAQNDSEWLRMTQLSPINPIKKNSHILHHFESVWVSLIWVRLDLTQTVSKWLKMIQKCCFRLASTMRTFLAYEMIELCFPIICDHGSIQQDMQLCHVEVFGEPNWWLRQFFGSCDYLSWPLYNPDDPWWWNFDDPEYQWWRHLDSPGD